MKNKYLIISNTFYPDRNSATQLLVNLASELSKKKKEVIVVCARDHNNYKKITKLNNIKIINVYCKNTKHKNLYKRGVGELLISKKLIASSSKIIEQYRPSDLICYSPPIFFNGFVKYLIKNYRCNSFLILRDLFPYWAISCKIIKNYFIKLFLTKMFKSFVKIFDVVGVEAISNIEFLKKKKIDIKKIIYLPNWINIYKKKQVLWKKQEIIFFGGNIGVGQDVKKVFNFYNKVSLLKLNMQFKIIGKNMSKDYLTFKLSSDTINKTTVYGSLSPKMFDNELDKSSYGVVSLDDRIESVNFPGRMLNYLKHGLPIILLTNKKNELSNFILKNKIGVVIYKKSSIADSILTLRKIKQRFVKDKYHNKVINKYFNPVSITAQIFNSFDK